MISRKRAFFTLNNVAAHIVSNINNLDWNVTTLQWFCKGHDKYEINHAGVLHAYIYSGWINVWH